tara:strand:+ start:620 stop:763 length:144 start_codon:yes stop_codon:yes gene_type:complete
MEEIPPVGVFHPMETEISSQDYDHVIRREVFGENSVEPVSEIFDVIG